MTVSKPLVSIVPTTSSVIARVAARLKLAPSRSGAAVEGYAARRGTEVGVARHDERTRRDRRAAAIGAGTAERQGRRAVLDQAATPLDPTGEGRIVEREHLEADTAQHDLRAGERTLQVPDYLRPGDGAAGDVERGAGAREIDLGRRGDVDAAVEEKCRVGRDRRSAAIGGGTAQPLLGTGRELQTAAALDHAAERATGAADRRGRDCRATRDHRLPARRRSLPTWSARCRTIPTSRTRPWPMKQSSRCPSTPRSPPGRRRYRPYRWTLRSGSASRPERRVPYRCHCRRSCRRTHRPPG